MRWRPEILFHACAIGIAGYGAGAHAQSAPLLHEIERQGEFLEQSPADDGEADGGVDIAPLPFSDPAFGTGGGAIVSLNSGPEGGPRSWVTDLGAVFTSSDAWAIGLSHRMSLGDDRLRLTAKAGYADARIDYYGIGADEGDGRQPVALRSKDFSATADAQMRFFDHGLLSHVHAGPRLRYLNSRNSPRDFDSPLPEPLLASSDSDIVSAGLAFAFQTRDDPFAPTRGVDVTGNWMFGLKGLGSDYSHRKMEILSTAYFTLDEGSVLAVRKTACAISGDAPFYDLCLFGEHGDLRGYEIGRYRDGASWSLHLELRQHLSGRLGGVAFVGAGGIADSSGDIWKHSHVLSSAGFGMRYRMSDRNRANLRADLAFGQDGPAFYLGIGEAF
ncbi:BamA/TamA family outer membrane protein [Croceicoccus sp. Ery5]|uniref:BamA/TamA family outer membrane protein n=1 Tax=Croceicoccus sp. Ery5 TaxID=1703340 RepID=UPI001E4796CA|nr:BamA/TamA family outer membrane protein [Croceicoccus sp. Ery5]